MRKVTVKTLVKTTPDRVIEAFTNFDMLKDWWQVERCLIQKHKGGVYTLAWQITENGFKYVSTGIIKKYDPNKVLHIGAFVYLNPEKSILGPMSLLVKANQVDVTTTEMYICQDGYQTGEDWDWYYQAVNGAWGIVASNLKAYLEK